jgi:hypothetical protein
MNRQVTCSGNKAARCLQMAELLKTLRVLHTTDSSFRINRRQMFIGIPIRGQELCTGLGNSYVYWRRSSQSLTVIKVPKRFA